MYNRPFKTYHTGVNIALMVIFCLFGFPMLIMFFIEISSGGEPSSYITRLILVLLCTFGFIFNAKKYGQKIRENQNLEYDASKLIPIEIYNHEQNRLQMRIAELERLTNSYNDERGRLQARIAELENIVNSYQNSNNCSAINNLANQNTYSANSAQTIGEPLTEAIRTACKSLDITVETPPNPETFFSRINFVIDQTSEMVKNYEDISIFFHERNDSPAKMLEQLKNDRSKYIDKFIINSYNIKMSKANELKSQAERNNLMMKFFDSLVPYENEMTAQNLETIQRLKNNCNLNNQKVTLEKRTK